MFTLHFLLFALIPIVFCAVSRETAPVKDEEFRKMGYACESSNPNLGYLRDGQIRTRYEHYICGQATCKAGEIIYETCGQIARENECIKKYEHYYKPYPDCCEPVGCE